MLTRSSRSETSAEPQEPDLTEFADLGKRIAEIDLSGRSRIRAELKQRLGERQRRGRHGGMPMISRRLRRHPVRALALAFALALAIALSFAGTRAALAALLRQIGVIRVTSEPTLAEQLAGRPLDPPPAPSDPTPTLIPLPPVLSDAAAEQAFGAPVYEPAALPDGFELSARDVTRFNGGVTVDAFYTNPAVMSDSGQAFVRLSQSTGDAGQVSDLAVGGAATAEVTVRGQPGLWVDQAALMAKDDGTGHLTGSGINLLIWSEGGNTFVLQSNHFDQPAMIRLAETLK